MTTWDIPLGPTLTEEQAGEIFSRREEAVVFALLQLAKLAAEKDLAVSIAVAPDSLSTPSGMKPPYKKPNSSARGKKKPGRKPGHAGKRRDKPTGVDQRKEHRADHWPACGGALKRCSEPRTRYTEDIPEKIQPVVTGHTIHRDWCPRCQKKVEPSVTDALPGSTLGQSRAGVDGVVALRLGQHAVADRGGVQLSVLMVVDGVAKEGFGPHQGGAGAPVRVFVHAIDIAFFVAHGYLLSKK